MRTIRYKEGYYEYQRFLQGRPKGNRAQMSALAAGLRRAMDSQLTERQRHYMELYYFHRLNMPRIAELEGVGVPSVSRTLARARERLHRSLSLMAGVPEADRKAQ